MVDRFERFSYSLFEISRCWHKLAAEEMEKIGLRGPYALYLVLLLRSSKPVTAARLSELSSRDKADVSRAVSAMVEKGLIAKEGPQYRAILTLTEAGREAANHVCARAAARVEQASAGYSDEQRQTFYQVLETLTNNLQNMSKDSI